jgi:tetrahydromethanopterin S-methyltransferase subunit B
MKLSETGERLAKIETTLDYLKEKIDSQERLIKEFTDSADTKYASKRTEHLVYALVSMVLIAFIGALIKLVISQ